MSRLPCSGSSPTSLAIGVLRAEDAERRVVHRGIVADDRLHEVGLVDARRAARGGSPDCRTAAAGGWAASSARRRWGPASVTLMLRILAEQAAAVRWWGFPTSPARCSATRRPWSRHRGSWSTRRGRNARPWGRRSSRACRRCAAGTCRTADRRCGRRARARWQRKRYGPLPTISVICLNGSVLARRSGIIAHIGEGDLPSASGSSGNGFFRRNWMVRSSGAESSSVPVISASPNASRLRPALDAGDAVAREHALAVMPKQAVAQGELPEPAVVFDRMALEHLRRDVEGCRPGRRACRTPGSRGCGVT